MSIKFEIKSCKFTFFLDMFSYIGIVQVVLQLQPSKRSFITDSTPLRRTDDVFKTQASMGKTASIEI